MRKPTERRLVTDRDVRELLAKGGKRLEVPAGAIVTSLATDTAMLHNVQIVSLGREPSSVVAEAGKQNPSSEMQTSVSTEGPVVFGSDHGGFQVKEALKKYAEELGYKVVDVGTSNEEPCDYPDFAYAVARMVSSGEAWRGVMIDGAGIGSCVVANKVLGVRAACCHNEFVARNAREHNDTNVLTLGSRVTGSEVCKEILRVWLESWFSGGRHSKRLEKVKEIEAHLLGGNPSKH